jgi:hypothetical protein
MVVRMRSYIYTKKELVRGRNCGHAPETEDFWNARSKQAISPGKNEFFIRTLAERIFSIKNRNMVIRIREAIVTVKN